VFTLSACATHDLDVRIGAAWCAHYSQIARAY
jgi:hypothetical protein